MLLAGRCVWLDDRGGGHLYLFLTECEGNPPQTIMVNVTSWRRGLDETCILSPNDHPNISKKSIIYYEDACLIEEWRSKIILRDCNNALPISQELLVKIQQGLCQSDETPPTVKDFYQRHHT